VPSRRRRAGKYAQKPCVDHNPEPEDEDDAHLAPGRALVAETDPTISAMEHEIRELEDEQVRRTNAYTGALNTIGSAHQRKWYLSLDRSACGLLEKKGQGRSIWEPPSTTAADDTSSQTTASGRTVSSDGRLSYPFYVRGVDYEKSVVTGRQGKDVLRDEGVTNFIARKGWTPVLE
jgi:hypothetical protein